MFFLVNLIVDLISRDINFADNSKAVKALLFFSSWTASAKVAFYTACNRDSKNEDVMTMSLGFLFF